MAKRRRVPPRKNIIRNLAGLAAFLLVPALTFTNTAPALASDPFYQCRFMPLDCHSIAFAENQYYGVESNFSDHALTLPSSEVENAGHISNEIWLVTTNPGGVYPNGLWVEFGVARACSVFVPPPGSQTCSGLNGTSKYFKFSASEDKNGNFFSTPLT
jgi:hypothetical protein